MGWGQKSFKLVWQCHQLLSRFLVKGHMLRVSRQSRLSTNYTSDNEMILGIVPKSPYLTAEENFSQETVDEGYATSRLFKWGPLPPNEVGRSAQHVKNEIITAPVVVVCGCG